MFHPGYRLAMFSIGWKDPILQFRFCRSRDVAGIGSLGNFKPTEVRLGTCILQVSVALLRPIDFPRYTEYSNFDVSQIPGFYGG